MTKEELAAKLNGREYGNEITKDEIKEAASNGLLVFFGYSDDNVEACGTFTDEVGCFNGGSFLYDREGFLPEWETVRDDLTEEEAEQYFKRKPNARLLQAEWDSEGYSWFMMTDADFAPFDILEDGEKFCRGIVVDMNASYPAARQSEDQTS